MFSLLSSNFDILLRNLMFSNCYFCNFPQIIADANHFEVHILSTTEMFTRTITESPSLYQSVFIYITIFATVLIVIILISYQRMCIKSSDNIPRHADPEPESIYMEL